MISFKSASWFAECQSFSWRKDHKLECDARKQAAQRSGAVWSGKKKKAVQKMLKDHKNEVRERLAQTVAENLKDVTELSPRNELEGLYLSVQMPALVPSPYLLRMPSIVRLVRLEQHPTTESKPNPNKTDSCSDCDA